ncbi:MAG: aminotransferase class I/II-fold pyridoxal phosphate-dependent enzyme [Proteobacteria bacterium]|nr:aminotransferase class I/II-fold pyridoxal phosphate-dependent enzyme [Pseudomonadota bacterium]
MQGYASGEQPEDGRSIKLNTNENPYPPSPRVAAALASFATEQLRIYPQPDARLLRQAIAEHHNISIESVVITHAGDEALRLAITTFVPPDGVVASTEPTYSLYPVLAQIQGASMFTQALSADWSLPSDFAAKVNAAGAQLTCVVNPHAPSGYFTAIEQLRELANDLTGVLLVDEAYADFVDTQDATDATGLVGERDNVLVLRTFSKGYSLAGLRLGYLLGHPSLIQPILEKTRDSYNVDAISQAVGLASIQDQDYAQQTWVAVRKDREVLAGGLHALGFSVAASQTNFLLAKAPEGAVAESLYLSLKASGILVRYFATPRLRDSLRITVGTPEQNAQLLEQLKILLKN